MSKQYKFLGIEGITEGTKPIDNPNQPPDNPAPVPPQEDDRDE